MPFLKKIETSAGLIGIWKLSETVSDLLKEIQLSESEKIKYKTFSIEKRQREFLAVRALLKKLTDSKALIEYENNGRPILINSNKKISISHSSELAVIFLSEKKSGIDVEYSKRKIAPIVKRFLSPEEIAQTEKSPDKQLMQTIYWSAKEAIFKCTTNENILFNKHILIHPFNLNENGDFQGELKIEDQTIIYNLSYFKVENNVIVYCVEM